MNIDRSVIWLRVKASDDVDSSPNVGRNFQRQATFPLRCTRELQMLSLSAFPVTVISCKLPSSPILACHSAVVITGIHINFVKPKRSQMFLVTTIYWESCRRPGKVHAAANDHRRCKSVISADQWKAETRVLFGMGWVRNANLCSWSFGYGRNAPC